MLINIELSRLREGCFYICPMITSVLEQLWVKKRRDPSRTSEKTSEKKNQGPTHMDNLILARNNRNRKDKSSMQIMYR